MKRFHSLIVVAAVTMILSRSVVADNPFDKFGRGRLLRKWRDDLTGKNKKPAPKAALKNKGKQPTPAGKGPTPATRPTQSPQRPGTNVRPSTPKSTSRQPTNANARSAYQQRATQQLAAQQRAAKQRATATQPRTTKPAVARKPSIASKAVGLGMNVVADKADQFVVTQIAPGGNAAKAGIQRGDLITKFAGTELGSIEEYDEISKILGAGDQIEIQVSRRGKEATLTVQNGKLPKLPTSEDEQVASHSKSSIVSDAPSRTRLNSKPVSSGQFEFVPKSRSTNGLHSVLEQPAQGYRVPQSRQSHPSLNGPRK